MKSQRKSLIAVSLMLAFVMAVVAFVQPAAAKANPRVDNPFSARFGLCEQRVTLTGGETVGMLASRYRANWAAIARANNLQAPYSLTAGQQLCIPGKWARNISIDRSGSTNVNRRLFQESFQLRRFRPFFSGRTAQ